ncbi:MAG: PEGA domain-containing protein [Nitrosomonadales bacterium]|nr:PEGA domain-containing protein [Nitrosomonadales bacterium]
MEERGNKTIMSSVLFLDIVEYSKKSVSGQISLKDRFNRYLSDAIRDVPVSDRIILDTGDGAAINFLGDVEDALKAALSLRDSLRNEDPSIDPPLLVRAGINLGPVRLVRDINGQPNIVGDGINVAQRVMGFAAVNQTLVSRSYYDAVSRLSPQYTNMFHYLGSRTDKHVREHEVYVVGHPGESTAELTAEFSAMAHPGERTGGAGLKTVWQGAAANLDALVAAARTRFAEADAKQRVIYIAAVATPVLLVGVLAFKLTHHVGPEVAPAGIQQADSAPTVVAAEPVVQGNAGPHDAAKDAGATTPAHKPVQGKPVESKAAVQKPVEAKPLNARPTDTKPADSKQAAAKPAEVAADTKKPVDQPKHPAAPAKAQEPAKDKSWLDTLSGKADKGADGSIQVNCSEGAQVFVDGVQKGKISSGSLHIAIAPGKHMVIVNDTGSVIYSQSVQVDSGKTLRIKPNLCD